MTGTAETAHGDEDSASVVVLAGPLRYAAVPRLSAAIRQLLAVRRVPEIVCELAAAVRPDLETIDVLLRLQLVARRAGGGLRLRHPSADLRELLALTGLSELLTVAGSPSGDGCGRQAEEREEPSGVQERDHLADPLA